jgi:hypothetical protein
MKKYIYIVCLSFLSLAAAGVLAKGGEGKVKVGYTFMDEKGNESVDQATFNQYEGFGLSLERFIYRFDNGIRLSADLQRFTLNNRNLTMAVEKYGLFGLRVFNNQYRRTYNFSGSTFTRRHRTGASFWVIPQRFVTVFGGGSYVGKTGQQSDLFDLDQPEVPIKVDYTQIEYNAGVRVNYLGRMLQAEYRGAEFDDNAVTTRDQTRFKFRTIAIVPVPRYDWLILTGGFQHFETKYKETDFKISANTVWGGATAKLPENFTLRYSFYFDRTGSDSDLVATDNLSNAVYLTHTWPNLAGLTAGYQHDVNDDAVDAMNADAGYFSGWLKPGRGFEIRAEQGFRREEMEEGSRLLGNEDRNHFKASVRYRNKEYGSAVLKFDSKNRENCQLGSEVDFIRAALDFTLEIKKYGSLSAGYAYATGEYENDEQSFEFGDHLVHADISSREYYHATGGFGVVYYRSKKDLDVESFTLRFNATYRFMKDYLLEVNYNVDNFDNFQIWDEYYTANIVEVNLIKSISF